MTKVNSRSNMYKSLYNLPKFINNLTDEQIINIIHKMYSKELIACIGVYTKHFYLSSLIETEDIYNEFLYACPKFVRMYDSSKNAKLITFLSTICKNYTKNYCRTVENRNKKIPCNLVDTSTLEVVKDDSEHFSSANNYDFQKFINYLHKDYNDLHKKLLDSNNLKFMTANKLNNLKESFIKKYNDFFLLLSTK